MEKETGRVRSPLRQQRRMGKSTKEILNAFSGAALVAFIFWLILRVYSYFDGSTSPMAELGAYSNSPLIEESDEFSWKQVCKYPFKYFLYLTIPIDHSNKAYQLYLMFREVSMRPTGCSNGLE
jgi:hypothetical protein